MLKYRFLLHINITWSAYFSCAIHCFLSLLSWICDQGTILINHEIPRILLFIIFRRREVNIDRCLVDCHGFFLLLVMMVNALLFTFVSWWLFIHSKLPTKKMNFREERRQCSLCFYCRKATYITKIVISE